MLFYSFSSRNNKSMYFDISFPLALVESPDQLHVQRKKGELSL